MGRRFETDTAYQIRPSSEPGGGLLLSGNRVGKPSAYPALTGGFTASLRNRHRFARKTIGQGGFAQARELLVSLPQQVQVPEGLTPAEFVIQRRFCSVPARTPVRETQVGATCHPPLMRGYRTWWPLAPTKE